MRIQDVKLVQVDTHEDVLQNTYNHSVVLRLDVVETIAEVVKTRNYNLQQELHKLMGEIANMENTTKERQETNVINEKLSQEVVGLQEYRERICDLIHWFNSDLFNFKTKLDNYIDVSKGNVDTKYMDDFVDAVNNSIERLQERVNNMKEE